MFIKQEKSEISDLIVHLEKLEKEEQTKSKPNGKKEK